MRSDQVWTLVFELALAAFLMWVDTRLFFLYFFAGVVWQTVSIKRTVLMAQVFSDLKLIAIAKHLNLTEDDLSREVEGFKEAIGPKAWRKLESEWRLFK